MSLQKVKEYFQKYGIADRIIEFDVSSATVELAAQAIGCEAERIAKTLSLKVGNRYILIVTSGDTKIDNSKYKLFFSSKATMLSREEAEYAIGHAVGGICPFAIKEDVEVYLDESLKRFKKIFPACGSSNSVIELTLDELEKYSNYLKWIDVCKPII